MRRLGKLKKIFFLNLTNFFFEENVAYVSKVRIIKRKPNCAIAPSKLIVKSLKVRRN